MPEVHIPTQEFVENLLTTKRQFQHDIICKPDELLAEVTYKNEEDKLGLTSYKLKRETNIPIVFTRSAISQLLTKLKIRTDFYDRCPGYLQQQIFNWFTDQYGEKEYLLRFDPGFDITQEENTSKDRNIRAVLTNRYGITDDNQLFPLVFDSLKDQNIEWRSFRYDDKISQLYVNFPEATTVHGDQAYRGGLVITNSETGHSSTWIEPIVNAFGVQYMNRATLQSQGVRCRFVHRGAGFTTEHTNELRNMILAAKDISQVGIIQMIEASQQIITKDHALAFARSINGLPSRFLDTLEEEWEHEAEVNRAAAAQKILVAARELPLFQRIQVEQATGQLVKVFDNYQARMQGILEELNG